MPQGIINFCPSHSQSARARFLRITGEPNEPESWPKEEGALQTLSSPRNLAFRSLRYFLTAFLSSDNCSWGVTLICSRRRNSAIRQISGTRLHQRRCKLSLSFGDRERRSTCCLRESSPFCSLQHFSLRRY